MKKILILFSFFSVIPAQAQVTSYLEGNPVWRESWIFNYSCFEVHNYMYYLGGDTVIGDFTYKKLNDRHHTDIGWFGPGTPPEYCTGVTYSDGFIYAIRQEGKKLILNSQGFEFLLYDFDLEVGDTLPQTFNQYRENVTVTAVDSLLVGNSYRKVFKVTDPQFMLEGALIEGIGFSSGFLHTFPDWEFPALLLCFKQYDGVWYPYPEAECDLSVGLPVREAVAGISVQPNPVREAATVFTRNPGIVERIEAIDLTGRRRQLSFSNPAEGRLLVDMGILAAGTWLLEIKIRDKAPVVLKIIKMKSF